MVNSGIVAAGRENVSDLAQCDFDVEKLSTSQNSYLQAIAANLTFLKNAIVNLQGLFEKDEIVQSIDVTLVTNAKTTLSQAASTADEAAAGTASRIDETQNQEKDAESAA